MIYGEGEKKWAKEALETNLKLWNLMARGEEHFDLCDDEIGDTVEEICVGIDEEVTDEHIEALLKEIYANRPDMDEFLDEDDEDDL